MVPSISFAIDAADLAKSDLWLALASLALCPGKRRCRCSGTPPAEACRNLAVSTFDLNSAVREGILRQCVSKQAAYENSSSAIFV